MKKSRSSKRFLEELKKVPIVQVACEKSGISRNTIYRWKREDEEFSKQMDEAIKDGEDFVNDMSESQLLQLIKEKSFSAVRFWLNSRHPKFKKKLEIEHNIKEDKLTPEQEEIVRKALGVVSNNEEKENEQ